MPLIEASRDKRAYAAFGLLAIVVALFVAAAFLPPLAEPQRFQGFADKRTLFGIPHFMNVVSNIPFLLVGILGLHFVARHATDARVFAAPVERWPYIACFLAVALTGVGSAYFHLQIDRYGLFWDRLPMAIGFMALLSAVVMERIHAQLGLRLLVPLLLIGAGSVVYWQWSLQYATENLLPYAIVQYGTIAAVLLICAVYPSRYTHGAHMVHVIAIYALAKLAEVLDARLYAMGELVSGHTWKHLIAAFATYWLLLMLRLRAPAERPATVRQPAVDPTGA